MKPGPRRGSSSGASVARAFFPTILNSRPGSMTVVSPSRLKNHSFAVGVDGAGTVLATHTSLPRLPRRSSLPRRRRNCRPWRSKTRSSTTRGEEYLGKDLSRVQVTWVSVTTPLAASLDRHHLGTLAEAGHDDEVSVVVDRTRGRGNTPRDRRAKAPRRCGGRSRRPLWPRRCT